MKSKVFIGHLYLQDQNGKVWAVRILPDGGLQQTDEFTDQERLEIQEHTGLSA
jgi:hypothetical protein